MKKKFDAEVEINDAPIICRDILTRNAKHEEVKLLFPSIYRISEPWSVRESVVLIILAVLTNIILDL